MVRRTITDGSPNDYRRFAERLLMVRRTITDGKKNDYRWQNPSLPETRQILEKGGGVLFGYRTAGTVGNQQALHFMKCIFLVAHAMLMLPSRSTVSRIDNRSCHSTTTG